MIEDGLTKTEMEDKIIEEIKKLIRENQLSLSKEFNLNIKDKPEDLIEWRQKVQDLFGSLAGQGEDGQKFIQIYGYNNIKVDI